MGNALPQRGPLGIEIMKAPGRVVAKSVLAEVWETSSTTGAALEVATMIVVKRALGDRCVVFDVPKPLPVGGVKLYGVLEDAEDDPKLARPVLLIRASPSVGACGCAERPKPSNASLPSRL